MAPIGIQIDGFPNATQNSQAKIPSHFPLKSGQILIVSPQNQWVPEPTAQKLIGFQESMEPIPTEPLIW